MMKYARFFLLGVGLLAAATAHGQVCVDTAPVGGCGNTKQVRVVCATGAVYTCVGSTWTVSAAGGSPGGPDTSVQINNGGVLGGDDSLTHSLSTDETKAKIVNGVRNASMYGTGTGTSGDPWVGWETAITTLPATTGGVVRMPSGYYTVGSTLTISQNHVTIEMDEVVLNCGTLNPCIQLLPVTNHQIGIRIKGMTRTERSAPGPGSNGSIIKYSGTGTVIKAGDFVGSLQTYWNEFADFSIYHSNFAGSAGSIAIEGDSLRRSTFRKLTLSGFGTAVDIRHVGDFNTFEDVFISNVHAYGYYFDDQCNNVTLTRCTTNMDSRDMAENAYGLQWQVAAQLTIRDSNFHNFDTTGYGCVRVLRGQSVIVEGNYFEGCADAVQLRAGTDLGLDGATVNGNYFTQFEHVAVETNASAGGGPAVTGLVVSDNYFLNPDSSPPIGAPYDASIGISLHSSVRNAQVIGNSFARRCSHSLGIACQTSAYCNGLSAGSTCEDTVFDPVLNSTTLNLADEFRDLLVEDPDASVLATYDAPDFSTPIRLRGSSLSPGTRSPNLGFEDNTGSRVFLRKNAGELSVVSDESTTPGTAVFRIAHSGNGGLAIGNNNNADIPITFDQATTLANDPRIEYDSATGQTQFYTPTNETDNKGFTFGRKHAPNSNVFMQIAKDFEMDVQPHGSLIQLNELYLHDPGTTKHFDGVFADVHNTAGCTTCGWEQSIALGGYARNTAGDAGSTTTALYGGEFVAELAGQSNVTNAIGARISCQVSEDTFGQTATGDITTCIGTNTGANMYGTARSGSNISSAYGARATISMQGQAGASISAGYALDTECLLGPEAGVSGSGAGNMTDCYGIHVRNGNDTGSGAITNLYGVVIEDHTVGATTNREFWNKGDSLLDGAVTISSTGSFNAGAITGRTAPARVNDTQPASCVLGDVWFDSNAGVAGQNLQCCTTTGTPGTWTTCGDGGGGGGGDSVQVNASAVTDANLNDTTPVAATGNLNVKWQTSGSGPASVSSYVQGLAVDRRVRSMPWNLLTKSNVDWNGDATNDLVTWWGKSTAIATVDEGASNGSGITWSEKYQLWIGVSNGVDAEGCDVFAYDRTLTTRYACAALQNLGTIDYESVALTDPMSDYFFVGAEASGSPSGNPMVAEFSILDLLAAATAGSLTAIKEWDTADIAVCTGSNAGLEGIAFVPDRTVTCSDYSHIPCGWFALACQGDSTVYRFQLNAGTGTDGTATNLAGSFAFPCGLTDGGANHGEDLAYDRSTGTLWLMLSSYSGVTPSTNGRLAVSDVAGSCLAISAPSTALQDRDTEGFALGPDGLFAVAYDDNGDFALFNFPSTPYQQESAIAGQLVERQACSQTGEGELCWDINDNLLTVGTGAATSTIGVETDPGVPLLALSDYGDVCAQLQAVRRASGDAANECFTPLTTEADGSTTNEGSLSVGAGAADTSLISSNTSGSAVVTLQAGSNITLSENETTDTITIAASGGSATGYLNKTIEVPTGSENVTMAYFSSGVTIDEVRCVTMGASSTATIKLRYAAFASRTSTGSDVLGNGEPTPNAIVCDTNGHDDSVAFLGSPGADTWLWVITTATTNSPTEVHVNVRYH